MKPPEAALRQLVRQWFDKATADFEAAEQLSTQGGRFREIVAFHCQQAVEKYLKALLVRCQVEFPKTHDIAKLLDRVATVDLATAESLRDAGFGSLIVLLATYGGQASDLRPWLAGAQINSDRNLRLQYLAGLAADLTQASAISDSFLAYRKFPDNIFTGSDSRKDALRMILEVKSKR